jgi:haloalkane dehalogenase
VLAALAADERPMLFLWADQDPILSLDVGERFAAAVNHTGIDHVIPEASHFLQEDQGPLIGEKIAEWLRA